MIEIQLKVFKTKHDSKIFNVNAHQMTNSSSNFVHRSAFMGPSLVRGSFVVRGFNGQNISSQKPRTREVLLYFQLCQNIYPYTLSCQMAGFIMAGFIMAGKNNGEL